MTASPSSAPPALRLGTYKLPAAETALIQTLLRLYAASGAGHWTYASEPPYDALLADGSTPEGQSPAINGMAKVVLRLMRKSENTTHDQLERPIRPDRFQLWLQSVERDLQQGAPFGSVRYRLLRWPPASMLHGNEEHVRLATLLSRRFFSAQELAAISSQSEAVCLDFMRTLQSARLLRSEAKAETAASGTRAAPPSSSSDRLQITAAAAAPRRSFSMELIRNIKKRLNF